MIKDTLLTIAVADGIMIAGSAVQSIAPHCPLPLEITLYMTAVLTYSAAVALIGFAGYSIRKALHASA